MGNSQYLSGTSAQTIFFPLHIECNSIRKKLRLIIQIGWKKQKGRRDRPICEMNE